jgi:hypothetical protein
MPPKDTVLSFQMIYCTNLANDQSCANARNAHLIFLALRRIVSSLTNIPLPL